MGSREAEVRKVAEEMLTLDKFEEASEVVKKVTDRKSVV